MDRVTTASDMGQPDHPDPAPYPVWSDSCWISMAAESADGTGPRVGRLVGRDTNCPDGQRQRVCHPLGFWERNVEELELRVLLGRGEDGVCQVIVEETDEEVYVRVLVHCGDEHDAPARRGRGYMDCPVRVWLDEALAERAVIDFDLDEELDLYVPEYLDNGPQADHGYHYAGRRRPSAGLE